ncbi:hypothetical protein GGR51DRAFT_570173 [Nemania sp. FL0031]|nr:hypothetical protein GGR51DRAFT_570173 [Nemania sp. FL0031]
MLRRPPTTLSLTAEDIASYEDRRQQAQLRSQAQAQAQAQAHLQPRSRGRHPTIESPNDSMDEAMEDAGGGGDFDNDEENDEEEGDDDDDDDDEDDDPFETHRLARTAGAAARAVSPGAQRGAYVQQMRARGGGGRGHARSQSHATHATGIPTSTSTYTSAAALRAQRITGSASASALPPPAAAASGQIPAHLQQTPVQGAGGQGASTMMAATRAATAAGRGGGGGGRQASEPPPAPTRITRSRDERIGINAPGTRPADNNNNMGAGGGGGGASSAHTETPPQTLPRTEPRMPLGVITTPLTTRRRIRLRAQTGTPTRRGTRARARAQAQAQRASSPSRESDNLTQLDVDRQSEEVVANTPPAEPDVEAGSPLPSQQRRQTRSYTMRLARQPRSNMLTRSMHARGYSDTTGVQTAGWAGAEAEAETVMRTSLTGTDLPHALDSHQDDDGQEQGTAEAEEGGVHEDDRMQID